MWSSPYPPQRAARAPGEKEGVDYFFVSRERFEEMLRNDELLEHAEFVGNCYGTPKSQVCARLESGVSVILDIEVQGAAQVKRKLPEAVTVFLAPPGLDALERRLRGRGTESEETIRARLDTARREMALAPSYDYTVINDDPDRASRELGAISTNKSHTMFCTGKRRIRKEWNLL